MAHSPNGSFAKWYIRQMAHSPNGTHPIWPSVSNSVLKLQYRGRYNTGISKMSIPVFARFFHEVKTALALLASI
jgi:hypothetical protein